MTPPFASSVASASLRSAPPAKVSNSSNVSPLGRARHERQRHVLPDAIGDTADARSARSMRCHSLNTQKARVAVAGSNGCGQAVSIGTESSRIGPARWTMPPDAAAMFFFTARDCLTSTVSSAMNSSSAAS